MSLQDKLEYRDGWWWPAADQGCWAWMNREPRLPERVTAHCRRFRTAIVAGANAGFYVPQYADLFESVIAVEPEPTNFLALTRNCQQEHVIKVQAVLGDSRGGVSMRTDCGANCGGYYVNHTGHIPTLTIDDFGADVDAIHLDVEGFEGIALRGAERTIDRCRPVIMVENIGNESRYGFSGEYVAEFLAARGYVVAEKLIHDTIYRWGGE